MSPATELDGLR
ncbi:hypothetical protein BN13_1090010 [Nostocoides jenkinsii Ben 74]|uniref:Uncharacterized protein n=1 Tax=Nostocoides jenkinsii Ben 74 TaxID=1193518 RepID=A0A077M706_9MICO|nr:hypothetical protein BN13_1090010 [Tetrasphaera jenkinsii Ben 74]